MRSIRSIALALIAVLLLVSCSRDKESTKRRYLESGNKYFEKKRFKEASIQYGNAVKIDPRDGIAHYKLALVALAQPQPDWAGALRRLRRAVELIPPSQQEHWDAIVKLSEIFLSPLIAHDQTLLAEVEGFTKALLARNPNSFDGLRLTGDLLYVRAVEAGKVKKSDEAHQYLDSALEQYRKADAIQPGNKGVVMQLARGLTLRNDFAEAEQHYRAVLDKDKTYLEAYRELYTLLWLQNKRKEAEEVLKTGYRANPKQYRFLVWLAEQYVLENRRDEMLGVLQQLKSKSGEYARAYFDVGDFYLRAGDGDSAIREYKEGMSKDSKNKASYQKRVIDVYMRQGKRTEAAEVNAQLLKDNPNDSDARGVAASLMLDKGDVAKALAELQQAVARSPNNYVSHYNLGRAYFLRGDAEQARQQLAKAIELRPDYTAARLAIAQLQVAKGEYDGALRSAQDILKYDVNNTSALLIDSAALMGQKRFDDSRRLLDQMLKVNPNSPEIVFEIGIVELAQQKFKDAEASFRRSYELNPANTRGLMGIVETYMDQGMTDQAVKLLQTECAKTPTRMDFHLALGNVAMRAGRFDMSIEEYQKVLATTEKGTRAQGEIYLRIGEAYRRKGDYAAAVTALQTARQTMPEDIRLLTTLGMTLAAVDKWNEARQVYEATQKLDPNNGVVLNNLAFGIAEHNGDLDVALGMATRASQLIPNVPDVSDTLGWIYLKKNLPDNAVPIFEALVTKLPTRPTFHYHLGLALVQKGDKARARDELKKALAYNPDADEKQKIQDLLARL